MLQDHPEYSAEREREQYFRSITQIHLVYMEAGCMASASRTGLSTKYIYTSSTYAACPLVGIGTPHPSSPASEWALPPEPKVGTHSPACEGMGESQFGRLERKLSILSTLWAQVFTSEILSEKPKYCMYEQAHMFSELMRENKLLTIDVLYSNPSEPAVS